MDRFRFGVGRGLAALVALATGAVASLDEHVSITAEPAWVAPFAGDFSPAGTETNQSERFLLFDIQYNVGIGATFQRVRRQIINEAGVQDGSRITLPFDPSYSRVALHRIEVHRDNRVINQLNAAKIQVLQREKDLERHLYNGELSAVIFLEDIRAGDQIEYSYTRTGTNPVFAGKFCEAIFLQWPFELARYRIRILSSAGRTLYLHYDGPRQEPRISDSGDAREYLWDLKATPALAPEGQVPNAYSPYARVMITEFTSWKDIAQWATQVFAASSNLPPEMESLIAQWQVLPDAEQRTVAALQFVQDQIRYLGFEFGEHSHQPASAATTCTRRFGDCKDKAVLLSALLNRLGVQASPALVNSRGRIDESAPFPLAFDHAIVCAKVNGHEWWLDPTLSYQKGPLEGRYRPDYRRGLVIRPDATTLSEIPKSTGGLPKTTVRESLTVSNTNSPAQLRVVTTMEGLDAEEFRAALGQAGRAAVVKSKLASYARRYPTIETNAALEISDNTNAMQTVESYVIPDLWQRDRFRLSCDVFALSIAEILDLPPSTKRRMPLAIGYPCRRLHTITINLPEHVRLADERKLIRGPADVLDYKRISFGRTMTINYDYRALADSIPIEQVAEHVRARRQMIDYAGLSLYWIPWSGSHVSLMPARPRGPAAWIIGFFCIGMVTAFRVIKKRSQVDSAY